MYIYSIHFIIVYLFETMIYLENITPIDIKIEMNVYINMSECFVLTHWKTNLGDHTYIQLK